MRRWHFGLMVVAVVTTLTLSTATECRAQNGNWADSLFTEHGIDFGPVPRGAKVRHDFVLTNRLNEPLTILDVRASCGCTSGRADASTVAPGASAIIEAQMDTRNFVGVKATTLTVMVVTASGQQGEARFGIRSNILSDVVLNPGSVDFGVVSKGQTPEQVVSIERVGFPNWHFTKVIASEGFCKAVDAKVVESYRSASGVGYQMTVRLKPDAPAGALRDEIRLLTNDPQSPSVPVLVTVQVQGGLTVSPAVLALGNVATAGSVQGRYLVRGTSPFRITGVEGNGEGFALTPNDSTPKTLHVLTLTYKPGAGQAAGDLRRGFRIQTDAPGESPLEVTATIRVVR